MKQVLDTDTDNALPENQMISRSVAPAIDSLVTRPTPQSNEEWLESLELFAVLLYDCTSSLECMNEARKQLFTQKCRTVDLPTYTGCTYPAHQEGYLLTACLPS